MEAASAPPPPESGLGRDPAAEGAAGRRAVETQRSPQKCRSGERAPAGAPTLLLGACAVTAGQVPHSGRAAPPHVPWDRWPRARGDTACLDFRAGEDPGSGASHPPAAGCVWQARARGKWLDGWGHAFILNDPSREWVAARGPRPPCVRRGVRNVHRMNRLRRPAGVKIAVSHQRVSSFCAQSPRKVTLWLASQGWARQGLS